MGAGLASENWNLHMKVVKWLVFFIFATLAFCFGYSLFMKNSLIWEAVKGKHPALLHYCLCIGADPDSQLQGASILSFAVWGKGEPGEQMTAHLLKFGADPKRVGPRGMSILHAAAKNGTLGTVKLLIDHGASVNALDSEGTTPLLLALMEKNSETAGLLLDNGADPDATNSQGLSPLFLAATNGQTSVLSQLVSKGAKNFGAEGNRQKALNVAKQRNYSELLSILKKIQD